MVVKHEFPKDGTIGVKRERKRMVCIIPTLMGGGARGADHSGRVVRATAGTVVMLQR